jgi:hypothetical protein
MRRYLPALREERCEITSISTWDYNCVGFVVGDYRWWHPEPQDEHYWPPGISRDFSVESYIRAFETAGFVSCVDGGEEDGFEKIAVYQSGGLFTHVTMQVAPGRWKSKLGELEDLEHPLEGLEGGAYGQLHVFLKRVKTGRVTALPAEYRIGV